MWIYTGTRRGGTSGLERYGEVVGLEHHRERLNATQYRSMLFLRGGRTVLCTASVELMRARLLTAEEEEREQPPLPSVHRILLGP